MARLQVQVVDIRGRKKFEQPGPAFAGRGKNNLFIFLNSSPETFL